METKLKIVVADDIKVIAENMQSVIAKNSRVEKVLTAFDGEDEVIKIMNLKPDIVFTDMQMPKKTGLEVIEEIQGNLSIMKKPKFILVTADRDSSLIVKARELGFDIVYKPISAESINEYINNFEENRIENENIERKGKEKIEQTRNELKKEGFFKRLLNIK